MWRFNGRLASLSQAGLGLLPLGTTLGVDAPDLFL
jgi:hypothetical protein